MRVVRTILAVALTGSVASSATAAQPALRKIGEATLSLLGITATVEPLNPVVPKNTASAVRIVVRAGGVELTSDDVARFLGGEYDIRADLSGPGLAQTISLPHPDSPALADPLLLPLPGLPIAGDYNLSNIRITAAGGTALDVMPSDVVVQVIDQILVTSVKTRPLTLEEIKAKGIVLDADSYLGFEFTLGMRLDSEVVNLSFPVVFDREGVPIPETKVDPFRDVHRDPGKAPGQGGLLGTWIPMLLAPDGGGGPNLELTLPDGQPVRIPSILVIPGNVGYLKQFFSAQLYVANGAPLGSGLTVREITGTVHLPPGDDRDLGTDDDPLALPVIVRNGVEQPQPSTMDVRGVGLDGVPGTEDDTDSFAPAEQGQAEFLIRGEKEGFHSIDFDIAATLEGLPIGPINVKGKATGGVLVRNPYFDMTFTLPSVVRTGDRFKIFVTVSNVGQGIANDVTLSIDSAALSGARLDCESPHPWCNGPLQIDTLRSGDAKTLELGFVSEKTGQVVASYLRFDAEGGVDNVSGDLRFTLGVTERGVPASPDTIQLPTAIDHLPPDLVTAAMRVIGQGWSLAGAPLGSLPKGVIRTSREVVIKKALALAEAGLRTTLGQPPLDALRDLVFDYWGGDPVDPGFDQLLRETEAGLDLSRALGAAVATGAATGTSAYEFGAAEIASSGPDFLSFSVDAAGARPTLRDGGGRLLEVGRTDALPTDGKGNLILPAASIPGGVVFPLGPVPSAPLLGYVSLPTSTTYTLDLPVATGFSMTVPQGGGVFDRVAGSTAGAARLTVSLQAPEPFRLDEDTDGDGTFDVQRVLPSESLRSTGPRFVSANVIGPETLSGASPFGNQAAFLFDRVVDSASADRLDHYAIPDNRVTAAKRQLSGRLVFASLSLPEGPYVPTSLTVTGVADPRGIVGPGGTLPLGSRIQKPGAVLSGRVVNADGVPLSSGFVTFSNAPETPFCSGIGGSPVANVPLTSDGRYGVHYVLRGSCGFKVSVQDPVTTLHREVSSFVRLAGEQILLDIALIGRGGVEGLVTDLNGDPVAGAQVVVQSETDPLIGGNTTTDGDGHYFVEGLTVGAVTVKAVKGNGLGRGTGRIDRAGTTAVVNLTLDGGTVTLSGKVLESDDGEVTPVKDALVAYYVVETVAGRTSNTVVGYAVSGEDGGYLFEKMPAGSYLVTSLGVRREGPASSGDVITNVNLVRIVPPVTELGNAQGIVLMPDGSPAPGVFVGRDVTDISLVNGKLTGVFTNAQGQFDLPELPVATQTSIGATTPDRLRVGSTTVFIDPTTRVATGVVIRLSGLGAAEFTVLDPNGAPISNLEVAVLGGCTNPCGCATKFTNSQGRVRFDGRKVGSITVQAVRTGAGYTDVAQASASITRDGYTAFETLRFKGAGTVRGTVSTPPNVVITGGEVVLNSMAFEHDFFTCGLVSKATHRANIDPSNNTFRFTGVNVGAVSVVATNPFAPSPVGASGTLTNHGGEVVFNLQFVDTTAGILSGVIYLPDGVTRAGAGVEVTANGALPDVTVRTNAAGEFRFARIFPAGFYTLTARDPVTGGTNRDQVFLTAGQDLARNLRLKGRGTVRVRVVDGSGAAVEEAFVKVTESTFPNRSYEGALSAANGGVATFSSVFEGLFSVVVSDPLTSNRGGRGSGELPRPGETVEVKVTLSIIGRVEGHFLMPDGDTPIPYGLVTLKSGSRALGQITTPASGPDIGSFAFDYVPAGPIRLEAQDPLTLRSGFAIGTIDSDGQVLPLDVIAQGLGTVQGTVTSRRSGGAPQPEPGADVEIVSGTYRTTTATDGEGQYVVTGVPEGRVVATATLGAQLLSGTAAETLTGDGTTLTLDVSLRDSGDVSGFVYEADGETPAPISTVTIVTGGTGGGTQQTVSNPDGSYQFTRVPAGIGVLSAQVVGGLDKATREVEVPSGHVDADIVLNGVGSLSGMTRDSGGNPIRGSLKIVGSGAFPYTHYRTVGDDGVYSFPELLAGPVTASFSTNVGGFTLYGTNSGVILPDTNTPLDIQVQPSGTVRGVIMRSDGTTFAYGTDVTVQLSAGGAVNLQAQENGEFEAVGIPLGALTVRAHDPITDGYALRTGLALETNGQVLDLGTITLDDSRISVVSIQPTNEATGVGVFQPITVTFSDPVQIYFGAVHAKKGSAVLSAVPTLSADRLTVTLTPTGAGWPSAETITVEATTAVTDIYNRRLAQAVTSQFVTVDLLPPVVTTVLPANDAIQIAAGATVAATFNEPLSPTADVANVVVLKKGTTVVPGAVSRDGENRLVFTPASPLDIDSVYAVTVNGAVDLSGNTQTQAFLSSFKTVDTVPPALAMTSPSPGTWVTTARPTIRVSVTDALSGPAMTTGQLLLDGTAVPASIQGNTLVFTPSSDLAEGAHSVEATAQDRGGNVGSVSAGFSIDTLAPSAAVITGATEGQTLRGTLSLGGSADDLGSGVARISLRRDGTQFQLVLPPTFSASYNTNGLAEGVLSLTAQATDVAGNVGPVGPPVVVLVDNKVLTVTITTPPNAARFRDAVTVKALVSEPVSRVVFAVGTESFEDTAAPYEATLLLAAMPEGPAVVTATGYGVAGEVTPATVGIVVDRTPPAAPDPSKITVEDVGAGFARIQGLPGAVEGGATLDVLAPETGATATTLVALDGSFSTRILADVGESVVLTATDTASNRGSSTTMTVERGSTQNGVPLLGMRLWVSADQGVTTDGSGNVQSWTDRSDAHNDLTQATASARPQLVPDGSNGWPVLRFDGNSDQIDFTTRLTNVRSVFWVVRESSAATQNFRPLLGDTSASDFLGDQGTATVAGSLWHPSVSSVNVRAGQTWVNGAPVDGTVYPRPRTTSVVSLITTGPVSAANFGKDPSAGTRFWWGDLAELIVYERPLSSSERQAVEDYLVEKYRPYVPAAAGPRFSPNGGVFTASTTVAIESNTPGASIHYTSDGSEPTESSPLYEGAFVVSTTTTVKAKAFAPGLTPSRTSTVTFMEASESAPSQAPGLALWLRGDAGLATNAQGVAEWADQSGNGNHATQLAGTAIPLLIPDGVASLPLVRFDGNDQLNFTNRLTNVRTVFWVVKESSEATQNFRSLLGDASASDFLGDQGTATTPGSLWHPSVSSFNVRSGQTWVNDRPVDGTAEPRPRTMSVVSLVTTGPVTAGNFGKDPSAATRFWWGDLAELIIYDQPLTAPSRKAVEDYLFNKYRLGPGATATAPIVSPAGGSFSGAVTVSLTTPTVGADIYYTVDGGEPTTSSIPYVGPFTVTETTTLKAKAFVASGASATTTVGFTSTAAFDARSLAPAGSLKLWWRADAGVPTAHGDLWVDQSGSGNHGFQPFGGAVPVLVQEGQNGLPVMRFDGNDQINFTNRLTNIRTVFWVVKESSSATQNFRPMLGDTSVSEFLGDQGTATTAGSLWHPSVAAANVRSGQTWVNDRPVDGTTEPRPRAMSVVSLVTTGPATAGNFGKDPSASTRFWWGDLAELLIYDQPLTASSRKAVEDYLFDKYRLGPGSTAVAPIVSPPGGSFTDPVTVSITSPTVGADIYYTTDASEPTTSSIAYSGPITVAETTTLKARAFVGAEASVTTTVGFTSTADFDPRSLGPAGSLKLWWRADAGVPTGHGDLWVDQSGSANHGFQPFGGAVPTLVQNGQNGLPVMRFDGSSDQVNFTTRLTGIRTVFWAVRESSAATQNFRPMLGDTSTSDFLGDQGTATTPGSLWHPSVSAPNVRSGQTWVNGTSVNGTTFPRPRRMSVVSLATAGPVTAGNFGKDPSGATRFWWGDLAELLVYDQPLTTTNRLQIESYLRSRYWDVQATAGPGQVALSWTPHPAAARYDVRRSTTSGGPYTNVATALSASTVQFTDLSGTRGVPYYYVVAAVEIDGTEHTSSEVSASPLWIGTGTGLTGAYFDTADLADPPFIVRTDATVNFTWGGAPATGMGVDTFSIRWTGQVQSPVSGPVTFVTSADDGVRLWIDDQLVIDDWNIHGETLRESTPVILQAGQTYDVRMEYFDNTGTAAIRLQWSYPGQALQPIPQSQLYP